VTGEVVEINELLERRAQKKVKKTLRGERAGHCFRVKMTDDGRGLMACGCRHLQRPGSQRSNNLLMNFPGIILRGKADPAPTAGRPTLWVYVMKWIIKRSPLTGFEAGVFRQSLRASERQAFGHRKEGAPMRLILWPAD